MELDHNLMKVPLQTPHIGSIEVVGRQVDVLHPWVVSLGVPNVSVLEHSLHLVDALEQLVAFAVELGDVGESLRFGGDALAVHVIKLNQVLREDEGVIEDEPQPLLLIVLLCPENAGDVRVHLGVDRSIPPDF